MKRMMKFGLMAFCSIMMMASCTKKSEYDQLVEKELASNIKQDSLFMGIKFGMKRKDFYEHSWELNKKGVFTNGVGNMSIKYALPDQLNFPATINFYPRFLDNEIFEMPVDFMYNNWALWDKERSSSKLLEDVKNMFQDWYDGDFIEVVSKDGSLKVWVMVTGNRRIRLWQYSVSTVRAEYTDLLRLETINKPS